LTEASGFTIARNAENSLPESVTGNGLSINRGFNGYGELAAQTVSVYSKPLLQWNVVRDNAGRIIFKTENLDGKARNFTYSYDAMGRLLTVTLDGELVESYSYDLSGTRVNETNTLRGINGRTFSYSDEDHLLTTGDAVYAYDPDGF
jgi:YD repeat-containing protein